MSLGESHTINSCCNNISSYEITYDDADCEKMVSVCIICLDNTREIHKEFGRINLWQENISKIICKNCNEDVTKTLGCQNCHPESFPNSKEVAP